MKALALLSGGLDSTLAIKVLLDQGIDIEAVNFFTPFCQCSGKGLGCGHAAKKVSDQLGLKLKLFNMAVEFLKVVENPRHGYGKNLNPCIDCRILMYKKAKEYMQEVGASFIVTGEVLGQRPMSQHRVALKIIEKESDLKGLILRPLSAKLMPITTPEQEGWVNREKLLEINGRSRKPQMALARDFNIKDYPCPAGGCLLTDSGFARRMRDLMRHSGLNLDDISLLKVGRHFRLNSSSKVVIGRNEKENEKLLGLGANSDLRLRAKKIEGPIGIARGTFNQEEIHLAASIVARYSDSKPEDKVEVLIEKEDCKDSVVVESIGKSQLADLRV